MKKIIILSITLIASIDMKAMPDSKKSHAPAVSVEGDCPFFLAEAAFEAGRQEQQSKFDRDARLLIEVMRLAKEDPLGFFENRNITVKDKDNKVVAEIKPRNIDVANEDAGGRWKPLGRSCDDLNNETARPAELCSKKCANFGGWAGAEHPSKLVEELTAKDPSNKGRAHRCFIVSKETMGSSTRHREEGFCLCNNNLINGAVAPVVTSTESTPAKGAEIVQEQVALPIPPAVERATNS